MSDKKPGGGSLFRAAGTVGFFTLLSRIFGFVRDMVIANYFGTRAAADAFFVAFRIPNLLRRLTAEGALSAAFIPLFAKTLVKDKEQAFRLANNLLVTMTFFTTLFVLAGILFSPQLLKVIAIGFTDNEELFNLTVELTRYLFPYIIFVSIAAILMGVLNTLGHFAAPAASPIVLNISIVLSVLFLKDYFDLPVYSLVVGVLIGGVCQVAIQLPFAIKKGFKIVPVFDLKSVLLRKVFKLTLPATLGFAVAEINMFVDTILASLLKEGSVSYLYYGNRLVLFPLGVIGIAMSTALLPKLSFQAGENNTAKMIDTLSKSIRAMMFLIIPSTIGLLILREPIVKILFERGKFDELATTNTAIALAYYAVGLLAYSGVKLAVSGFYSLGDTKTPVRIASYAMLCNIGLNLLLMGPLQHGGLALATSLSSFINFFALVYLLRAKFGSLDGKRIFKSMLAYTVASLLMGAFIYYTWEIFRPFTIIGLSFSIVSSAVIYFAVTWILGMEEMRKLVTICKGKLVKS